jgi:hypothetical protein
MVEEMLISVLCREYRPLYKFKKERIVNVLPGIRRRIVCLSVGVVRFLVGYPADFRGFRSVRDCGNRWIWSPRRWFDPVVDSFQNRGYIVVSWVVLQWVPSSQRRPFVVFHSRGEEASGVLAVAPDRFCG